MSPDRPYFSSSTQELEAIFEQNRGKPEVLKKLQAELAHRKRPRARKLHERIAATLRHKPEQGSLLVAWDMIETKQSHHIDLVKKPREEMQTPEMQPCTKKGLIAFLRDLFGKQE